MDHKRELIDRLCTAVGMIMENTVEVALVTGSMGALPTRIALLDQAGRDVAALAHAAAVVVRRGSIEPILA